MTLLAVMLIAVTACGTEKPASAPADQQSSLNESENTGNELQEPDDSSSAGQSDEGTVTETEGTVIDSGVNSSGNSDANNTTEGTSNEGATTPSEETKQETIKLFYTDPEQMELKETEKQISFKSDWSKYESAFKALQTSDNDELIPLWSDEITINQLKVEDGNITLDLKIPATAHLGSGGEQFAIDALKQTFFQFDEVKSIDLLVDGEQTESLMGHVELEHPMTRE